MIERVGDAVLIEPTRRCSRPVLKMRDRFDSRCPGGNAGKMITSTSAVHWGLVFCLDVSNDKKRRQLAV